MLLHGVYYFVVAIGKIHLDRIVGEDLVEDRLVAMAGMAMVAMVAMEDIGCNLMILDK